MRNPDTVRRAHAVASIVLSYPGDWLPAMSPALKEAVGGLPRGFAEPLGRLVRYLETTAPTALAAHYVDTFDMRRRCCLYLSYYTHGDTRRRGMALLAFVRAYQAVGLAVTDELPDHLPVVLEFSAAGNTRAAIELLVAHRPGLDLLGEALAQARSPYAHAVAAVRASLPAPGPADVVAAHRLAQLGPPAEEVGVA
jgi:nitrate reductase delta subunit